MNFSHHFDQSKSHGTPKFRGMGKSNHMYLERESQILLNSIIGFQKEEIFNHDGGRHSQQAKESMEKA